MTGYSIEPLAEDALLLRFGTSIDMRINARVHASAHALREARLQGITEIAPAYASLLIRFDPFAWNHDTLSEAITQAPDPGLHRDDVQKATASKIPSVPCVEIPVCYDSKFGPDLETVAVHAKLSSDEVVARHTAGAYTVAMLGFAPGFPYLLGLDPALHMPRRADPRTRVAAGSVAIGGAQTGIYPRELPGGWQLIGRTPLRLFDPAREAPCLLEPGQRVRFRAIDADTFTRLSRNDA